MNYDDLVINYDNLIKNTTMKDWEIVFKRVHGIADLSNMNQYDLVKTMQLFIAQATLKDARHLSNTFKNAL